MSSDEPFERADQQRLRLFLYLIPFLGLFPAVLSLYRQRSQSSCRPENRADRQEHQLSRQTVSLAALWTVALVTLNLAGWLGESPQITVLLLNSVLTSGYFLVNFWLMVQLGRGKRPELPGLNALGNRLP